MDLKTVRHPPIIRMHAKKMGRDTGTSSIITYEGKTSFVKKLLT